jgi:hypothetical protein
LRWREPLATKHEHLAAKEFVVNPGELRVGQRTGEIDSASFEAKARRQWMGGEHDDAYFRNSGANILGTMSGISGQTINEASTSSIGTSMITVSFSA